MKRVTPVQAENGLRVTQFFAGYLVTLIACFVLIAELVHDRGLSCLISLGSMGLGVCTMICCVCSMQRTA